MAVQDPLGTFSQRPIEIYSRVLDLDYRSDAFNCGGSRIYCLILCAALPTRRTTSRLLLTSNHSHWLGEPWTAR